MENTQLTPTRVPAPYSGRHRAGANPDIPAPPVPTTLRGLVAPADFHLPVGPHDETPEPASATSRLAGLPQRPALPDTDDEDAGDLELLLRSADIGPAKKPLIGNPATPSRVARTSAAFGLVTMCLLAVGTVVGGTVVVATAQEEDVAAASYTRPGGKVIDVRQVTCPMLARDIVTTDRPVQNNPVKKLPLNLHNPRPVLNNLDVVAEVPAGDAITCRATGLWPRGVIRDVTFTLSAGEGISSMKTTTVTAALR